MADEKTPSLGLWVEWSLKVGPLLASGVLFFFTLYSNQTAMIKHDGEVDKRLAELERAANMQDRELTNRLAKIDAALSELNHDLQFYQQTRSNGR
jgi:hypothetical protein